MKSLINSTKNFIVGFVTGVLPQIIKISAAIVLFTGVVYGVTTAMTFAFTLVLTMLGVTLPLVGFAGLVVTIVYVIACYKIALSIFNMSFVVDLMAWLLEVNRPRARRYTVYAN